MKFDIKNISRCLVLVGLYPGESKQIDSIDDNLRTLQNKGLITITTNKKINKQNKKESLTSIEENNVVIEEQNIKDCEVENTYGGN